MYNDLLNGPPGKGLEDSRALERKGVPQTLEGFMGQDSRRVELLLNQIRGFDSTGTRRVGVPAVFGMGLVSFGAIQKSHGYKDGDATPSEALKKTLDFVDDSIGRIVGELKSQKLYDSTVIVLTAKHGQSPIDVKQRRVIGEPLSLRRREAKRTAIALATHPRVVGGCERRAAGGTARRFGRRLRSR